MLSVDPDNDRAIRRYERSGFTLVDTDDPARGTSLIMRVDVAPVRQRRTPAV